MDDALEAWVDATLRLSGQVGPGGRLVMAVLGRSLADGRPSYWFGYEPTRDGLATLLAALGEVWRCAAATQSWRGVQLDPGHALGQVRWYPGCPTRAYIGYADPLNLSSVQRALHEHRGTDEEWQALRRAQDVVDREVDPLAWRLSSLAFAVSRHQATY